MKLKQIILPAFILFVFGVFSQGDIVVGSKKYDEAKRLGTLDRYNLVYNFDALSSSPGAAVEKKADKYKPNPNPNNPKTTDCDCYVEPDGTYTIAMLPNDDGSSALITIPFNFNFYGVNYNSFYINNNGNITFVNALASFSSTAFPSAGNKIIAPFWGDVDTRAGNGQVVYKITPTAVYVNWKDVGYYSQQGDKRNTFQLIITDGSDPSVPNGNNVAFCYQDMQWTTGSASGGVNGFGGIPATCGANEGNNVSFFLIARFDHAGTDFDGALGANDGISWLDYKSFFFDISTSGNIPPIPQGVSACDTFKICSFGDTADISLNFFAPEADQTTTITYSNGGLTSLQEIANITGNTAQLVLRVIGAPGDAGVYTITVTATDDYAPTPGVTSMNFVIVIEDNLNNALNPVLSYTQACDSFPISVLNGPYDTYLWDNLSTYPSTYVQTTGDFGVTVSLANCYQRVTEIIYVPEPANFNLQGNLYLCPGEDSTFLQLGDSLSIDIMDWNLGNAALDGLYSNWLLPGTYTINNIDSTGLCPNDTTFTIGQGVASSLFSDTASCFGLNFQATGVSMGTNALWSSPDPQITFSNASSASTVITASTYGTYTVNLTSPCITPLTAQITYPFAPTIFGDTSVCGTVFNIPVNQVNTFGPATWSTLVANSGTFSPNNMQTATTFTAAQVPYQFQLTLSDNLCPNLNATATVLMVEVPVVTIPTLGCYLQETDITATPMPANHGIQWSFIDNPSTAFLEDTAASFINSTTSTSNNPDVMVSNYGNYTMNYVISGPVCNMTGSGTIYFPPYIYTQIYDTTLCNGVEYDLNAYVSPYPVTYSWNTGQTGTSTVTINEPGLYIVSVTNECYTFSDSATINYIMCDIQAPNVISLSSTTGNNLWFVNGDGIAEFECTIVNRWGNVIYSFNNVSGSWDGKNASGNFVDDGVYFYTIKAKAIGGENVDKQGFITVVR